MKMTTFEQFYQPGALANEQKKAATMTLEDAILKLHPALLQDLRFGDGGETWETDILLGDEFLDEIQQDTNDYIVDGREIVRRSPDAGVAFRVVEKPRIVVIRRDGEIFRGSVQDAISAIHELETQCETDDFLCQEYITIDTIGKRDLWRGRISDAISHVALR
jgi:hypothetical protein